MSKRSEETTADVSTGEFSLGEVWSHREAIMNGCCASGMGASAFLSLLVAAAAYTAPSLAPSARSTALLMRARYEDGEDKRLSQGGSGGGIFRPNSSKKGVSYAYTNTESRRFSKSDKGQMIRKAKLDAYIDNDLEPADPTFGKIIAGRCVCVSASPLWSLCGLPRVPYPHLTPLSYPHLSTSRPTCYPPSTRAACSSAFSRCSAQRFCTTTLCDCATWSCARA